METGGGVVQARATRAALTTSALRRGESCSRRRWREETRESVGGIAVGTYGECVPSGSCGSFERLVHLLNEFEVFLRAREAGQFPAFAPGFALELLIRDTLRGE